MADKSNPNANQNEIERRSYKALPRDPNQTEHKKPRVFIHRPDENPQEAEEARRNASYTDAAKTITLDDFQKVHQKPCVRQALLPAIGGGLGIGALRFVVGGSVMAACNWASGSFCGVALVAYNVCQAQRTREKEGIRKAVQVLDEKQAIKDAQAKVQAAQSGAGPKHATSQGQLQQGDNKGSGSSIWSYFKFW